MLTPEQKEALRKFKREIKSRLDGEVPDEEKRKLLELLRVNLIYDDTSKQINIGGVMGSGILTSKSRFGERKIRQISAHPLLLQPENSGTTVGSCGWQLVILR